MNNHHHIMILQYLMRITSELEVQLQEMQTHFKLQNADSVDIIDYIEMRASYHTATKMERDILNILSWNT